MPLGVVRLNGAGQIRRLRQRVVRPQALDQARMNDLGVLGQGRDQDADADAAAEVAHQAADRRALGQDVARQRRQRDDVQRHKGAAEAETLQQSRR